MIEVSATPSAKRPTVRGLAASACRLGETPGAMTAKATPRTTPASPETSSAVAMNDTSSPGWRGNSPISSVPSRYIPAVPSRVIVEMLAPASPTDAGSKRRAASSQ